MDTCYFLTTGRLGFRLWTEEDLELAMGLWGDYQVTRFFDKRGSLSGSQVKTRLDHEIKTQTEYGVQYWPVFSLESKLHIGCAGLRPCDQTAGIHEIGFHIRPAYWRLGYAYEAARGIITYAFDTLNVTGLFAGHNPENHASGRLLEKLGFRYTHDEFYEPTGLHHPSYLLTRNQAITEIK